MPSLPEGFIGQLAGILGSRLPDFLHSYEEPPTRGLRTRPGVALGEPLDCVPWAENGVYIPFDADYGARIEHEAGAYYLQEPSAMVPAAALGAQPGDRVLDLCAAPGGKSTQLGAALRGTGLLVSNEPVPDRARVLARNLERMGIPNACVTHAYPDKLSPVFRDFFDKVLVDAPCSGEGMFRRHPETVAEWDPRSPALCAERQKGILEEAYKMLRPGGTMVYSTCTFNPIENEQVIEHFITEHSDMSLSPFRLPGLPENDGMLHLWPHEIRGEGHFCARLCKEEGAAAKVKLVSLPAADKTALSAAEAFLKENVSTPPAVTGLFAGKLVSAPLLPALDKLRVLRMGLTLGETRGRVFIPDHALALAAGIIPRVPVTEAQARAYLAGEEIDVPGDVRGFAVPDYRGFALGWGKASDGKLKNHYPKGIRTGTRH